MQSAKYCKKCHEKKRSISYQKAVDEFRKKGLEVEDECISVCGYGKKNYFIEVEDEVVMADSFEKLINKMEDLC